jgi:UV DNA damage endonuclease
MKLSLCCISLRLQERGHKFQTMTYTRFSSLPRAEAIKILSERILNNFEVTGKIIQYCHQSGIEGYRLSSNITPIINHPDVNLSLLDLPNADKIFNEINNIKNIIKFTGVRVSAHPSEYISLSSDDNFVISNSIRDLESHAELFDLFDLPQDHRSPLNIHVRQDGDPEEISNIVCKNFDKLSDSVKKRLVFEVNDNVGGTWNISNLVKYFYNKIYVPITFDSLHRRFCSILPEQEDFNLAFATWKHTPLFHFSDGVDNTRKHSDYTDLLPNNFGKDVFWDVELKAKDLAIEKIFLTLKEKSYSLTS